MARFRIPYSRLALAATWLVAVVVCTGIGLLAVNTVGDAASDRGPLGPDTLVVGRPDLPSPPASPPPGGDVSREFRYEFGEFVAACRGPFVRVLSTAAEPGWEVTAVETGPDDDIELTIVSSEQKVEVEIFCNRGAPDISELDRARLRPEEPAP